jgi:poly(beta-D-mannuronate) lyase
VQIASAAEYRVSSSAELVKITKELKPGDAVVLKDGDWRNQELIFRARGTETQPITFRAESAGKVIVTGQSSIEIDGEHVVVAGLNVQNGEAAKEGVVMRGNHCRFTDSAVVDSTYKFYVRLFGTGHRVDHCYLAGKTSESPTVQVEVEATPNRHRIDHNHFGPRPPLGKNGGETIRVGYSHQSMLPSATLVEANLFDRCDGELEIISNKSCENIYRANTFLECAGMFTLRHGNRCRVEGNFFLGRNKRGSGGIRVIGEDHVIVNNYIDGVTQGGFWVTAGIPNSPLVGYFQAKNCLIAFNTVVDSRGPCVEVAAGLGSSGRTLPPIGITMANNLFAVKGGEPLRKGKEEKGYRWLGNLSSASVEAHDGIRAVDLQLARGSDGLWRPKAGSPARGAAEGAYGDVKTDIDGQDRVNPRDVGCDQISDAATTSQPLTPNDVGPAWRRTAPRPAETSGAGASQ